MANTSRSYWEYTQKDLPRHRQSLERVPHPSPPTPHMLTYGGCGGRPSLDAPPSGGIRSTGLYDPQQIFYFKIDAHRPKLALRSRTYPGMNSGTLHGVSGSCGRSPAVHPANSMAGCTPWGGKGALYTKAAVSHQHGGSFPTWVHDTFL